MEAKEFYSIVELAELFGVNEMTGRKMGWHKALPYYKLGRMYRFKRAEVEAFLKKCEGVRLEPDPGEKKAGDQAGKKKTKGVKREKDHDPAKA